jgi:hypothetical protein
MNLRFNLFLSAVCAWCFSVSAQELDLSGNVGWFKSGSRIRLEAALIENNRDFTSGLLRLQVWATTEPYDGVSDIVGYVIGSARLPRLGAGGELVNVVRRAAYRRPPADYYYTTMTLEERQGDQWLIVDSANLLDGDNQPTLVNLGGFGFGAVDNLEPNGLNDLTFAETLEWLVGDGRAELTATEIRNERASGISGAVRVRLFASTNGFTPGETFFAFPMATKRVGRIPGGGSVTQLISSRTRYRPPPPSVWIITMTLEEYNRGWIIRDHYNFMDPRLF